MAPATPPHHHLRRARSTSNAAINTRRKRAVSFNAAVHDQVAARPSRWNDDFDVQLRIAETELHWHQKAWSKEQETYYYQVEHLQALKREAEKFQNRRAADQRREGSRFRHVVATPTDEDEETQSGGNGVFVGLLRRASSARSLGQESGGERAPGLGIGGLLKRVTSTQSDGYDDGTRHRRFGGLFKRVGKLRRANGQR